MLKYIFKFLILLISLNCYSQSKLEKSNGLRFGVDLSRYAVQIINPDIYGHNFSMDAGISKKIIAVFEFGPNKTTLEKNNYDYKVEGNYIRIGADKKIIENINDILIKHTNQPRDKIQADIDRDFIMTPAQAKEYKIIDMIITTRARKKK